MGGPLAGTSWGVVMTGPRTEKITKTDARQHWLVDDTGLVVGGPYGTMTKANNALRRFFPAPTHGGHDVATSCGTCGHDELHGDNIYLCRSCQSAGFLDPTP